MPVIRINKLVRFFLGSILMLDSLTAVAQGGDDGDFGSDPGLPAEAPPAPAPNPPRPQKAPAAGSTMPAPAPESPLVTPYDSPAQPAMPMQQQQQQPAPKRAAPPITGKLAELNLTPEQAQQIVEARKQWKPELEKRLKEEFNFLKQNLAQAMADNSPGEEVRRRFEAMQKKYLELQTIKFEKLLRIREVLTPEQRRKFAEIRSRPAGKGGNDND